MLINNCYPLVYLGTSTNKVFLSFCWPQLSKFRCKNSHARLHPVIHNDVEEISAYIHLLRDIVERCDSLCRHSYVPAAQP